MTDEVIIGIKAATKPHKLNFCTAFTAWAVKQVRAAHWSLDACVGYARLNGLFKEDELVCTKTLYNELWAGRLDLTLFELPEALKRKRNKGKNRPTENPTYEEVCYRNTGHAETVQVIYDADTVPLDFLLNLYYEAIDPVSLNRQGGDTGTQYRTGIYYVKEEDRPIIEASISKLKRRSGGRLSSKVSGQKPRRLLPHCTQAD